MQNPYDLSFRFSVGVINPAKRDGSGELHRRDQYRWEDRQYQLVGSGSVSILDHNAESRLPVSIRSFRQGIAENSRIMQIPLRFFACPVLSTGRPLRLRVEDYIKLTHYQPVNHHCSEKDPQPRFNSLPNHFPPELAGLSAGEDGGPENELDIRNGLIAQRGRDQETPVIEIIDAVQ